jgi:glucokinase
MTTCLLADIGGTRARFALLIDGQLGPTCALQVGMHPDPVHAIQHFLNCEAGEATIDCAVIAAAGPVSGGRCKLTNADWTLDSAELKKTFGLITVRIINDMEAQARALPHLLPADCVQIGHGHAVGDEPAAVLSPGTGLGIACFMPSGDGYVLAGEGGHASVAATDALGAEVIALLRKRYEHVSAERILSGPGLVNLYQTLGELNGVETDTLTPARITQDGLDGSNESARHALDLFCAFLGSVAGDVALTFGTRGGVYVGGGIVPRIVDYLPLSRFRAEFESKGRLRSYMERVPTQVVIRPATAFLGLRALAQAAVPFTTAP